MAKNIVLIGLPGCGKTTFGRQIAKKMNMAFIDLDDMIKTMAGKSIPQIFAESGEENFRKIETLAVKTASLQENTIISTGGGVVVKNENIDVLQKNGILIFVDRDPMEIAKDVKTDDRPLMTDNEKIFALDKARRPLYETAAHYKVKTTCDKKESFELLFALCKKIAKKQQFYVIGTPVSHSLSPVIHLQVMSRYLCAPFYDIENVEKNELTDFVQRVRDEGASGFNITMPHKAAIIPLLDEVSGEAMALNSVNTVVNVNGRLKGFSTDGEGFYKALCEKTDPSGKNIVMLGAGGAANAVLLFLASKNVGKVTVLARKPETAMTLAQKANAFCKKDICGFDEMTKENLCKYASSADIFINATSLGMQGVEADFESLEFVKKLPKTALVCDLIYKPEYTNLLKMATQNGIETMGGIKMLINQALIADGFYLGENALINSKTETLQMAIKGALKIT